VIQESIWIVPQVVLILAIAILVGSLLPGFERKVQARIQQRIGPPILTPGFWTLFKFSYKKKMRPNSPMPSLYVSLLPISISLLLIILLFASPPFIALLPKQGVVQSTRTALSPTAWYTVLGWSSVIAVVGLLKVEELLYVLIGSLSQSVLSVDMPIPDLARGAKIQGFRREYVEQHSAVRAFKMIGVGSFPIYITLIVPFAIAKSVFVEDLIRTQNPGWMASGTFGLSLATLPRSPNILTFPGAIASIAYFVGFMILLNEKPFNILKAKMDVIEGPLLEYGSVYRTFVYLLREAAMFVLASVFVTFFIGIPLDPFQPLLLAIHLLLIFVFIAFEAVMAAFSPILTFRQIYPISFTFSAIAAFALLLAAVM
jgi:energy-converting hydrogenase B subunit O